MNNKDRQKLQLLINELRELKNKAELRSNELERTDSDRAKSCGYTDAYSYCILRLEMILYGKFASTN